MNKIINAIVLSALALTAFPAFSVKGDYPITKEGIALQKRIAEEFASLEPGKVAESNEEVQSITVAAEASKKPASKSFYSRLVSMLDERSKPVEASKPVESTESSKTVSKYITKANVAQAALMAAQLSFYVWVAYSIANGSFSPEAAPAVVETVQDVAAQSAAETVQEVVAQATAPDWTGRWVFSDPTGTKNFLTINLPFGG